MEAEKYDVKVAFSCQRMASGLGKSIESDVDQTLIDFLNLRASKPCSAEVARQELQESKMRSDQVGRGMLTFYNELPI